jgi:hypothetical protein
MTLIGPAGAETTTFGELLLQIRSVAYRLMRAGRDVNIGGQERNNKIQERNYRGSPKTLSTRFKNLVELNSALFAITTEAMPVVG